MIGSGVGVVRSGGRGTLAIAVLMATLTVGPARGATGTGRQATNIRNARLQVVDGGARLEDTLVRLVSELPAPSWIAWEVASVSRRGSMCCCDDGATTCRLEGSRDGMFVRDEIQSADAGRMRILMRVEDRRIERLRTYSAGCALDAGGLPVAWVRGVAVGASLSALRALVEGRGALGALGGTKMAESAVAAVALHDAAEVTPQLASWARQRTGDVHESAIFWLGAGRGEEGVPALEELVQTHPDADVREQATFGLHVSGSPRAVDILIQVARGDAVGSVRSRALFWLAQRAGERAAAAIEGSVREDPDLEVRKQAVFALSQLPADRGIPLLIHVARTHPQPEVRKRAIFWLGQSGDERALDFIEELLRG